MNRKREKKCIQSDQPAWNLGGASATPQSRKLPVFDCAVALCTMQNALLVISNLTWLVARTEFLWADAKNNMIEVCKEEGRAVSTLKTRSAERMGQWKVRTWFAGSLDRWPYRPTKRQPTSEMKYVFTISWQLYLFDNATKNPVQHIVKDFDKNLSGLLYDSVLTKSALSPLKITSGKGFQFRFHYCNDIQKVNSQQLNKKARRPSSKRN
jgi:hypothetical protein